jgi:pimeloyl-[acyl-carrier protein] synthase
MKVRERLSRKTKLAALTALIAVERLQTGVAFNPLARSFRVDPYAVYRRLRETDPFHRSRAVGGWVLTRHADVSAVLRDPKYLVEGRKLPRVRRKLEKQLAAGEITQEEFETTTIIGTDPPAHTRLRALVSKAFTRGAIDALRLRIAEIVHELLARVPRGATFDVIRTLAHPLPVIVIAEMLGIPHQDRQRFKRWSDELVRGVSFATSEEVRRASAARREFNAYLTPIMEERRREPRGDLVSLLVATGDQGEQLEPREVRATIGFLLVAGNETTANLIGNGLLALLRDPAELERLRSQPALMHTAIDELLRYDSPVQATSRFSLVDTEVNGHPVKAGEQLLLSLGGANRDPEQFPDPDKLDIGRVDNRQLSLGQGLHYCLGAPLTRAEASVAFGGLLERFPAMRLAEGDLEWNDSIVVRGLRELRVATS